MKRFSIFVAPIALVLIGGSYAQDLIINTTEDFVNFANNVNNMVDCYDSKTIVLNTDIDLSSKQISPIGGDSPYGFRGHFDGRGHTISGLSIDSDSNFTGLFGRMYWYGSVRNLVLDETCTVRATHVSSNGNCYVGGIVGDFYYGREVFYIENCVNMASVTFSGDSGTGDASFIRIGGIVGNISPAESTFRVINCVNFGAVTNEGKSDLSFVGGIVGFFDSNVTIEANVIRGCANYGAIKSIGTGAYTIGVGGIVGKGIENFVVDKCVNYGSVVSDNAVRAFVYTGGIIGNAEISNVNNPLVIVRNSENHGNVTNSATTLYNRVGGIAGACDGKSSLQPCTVINCVNDGNVIHNGTTTSLICLGGITGHFCGYNKVENCVNLGNVIEDGNKSSSDYISFVGGISGYAEPIVAKNCANYGEIEFKGNARELDLGGIFGKGHVTSDDVIINNCLNGGLISQQGIYGSFNCGGIVGFSVNTTIDNCVSAGEFSCATGTTTIGGIIGYSSGSEVSNCYWKDTLAVNVISYDAMSESIIENSYSYTFTSGNTQTITTSAGELATLLNSVDESLGYSKWAQNTGEHSIDIVVNGKTFVSSTEHVFLFPSFVTNDADSFSGWYNDSLASNTVSTPADIVADTVLYGVFGTLRTITFAYGDVTLRSVQIEGSNISYPTYNGTKVGHTFKGWCTEGGSTCNPTVVPDGDITLTETYTPIKYTATFKNGYDESGTIKEQFEYGEDIVYPTFTRSDYAFDGWTSDPDVTDGKMPASDVTFTAKWTKATEYVEIVFGSKDIKKDDIEGIIKKYTNDKFVIEQVSTSDTGEIKVIIKFVDKKSAETFVRTVNTSGRTEISYARISDYTKEDSSTTIFCSFITIFSLV